MCVCTVQFHIFIYIKSPQQRNRAQRVVLIVCVAFTIRSIRITIQGSCFESSFKLFVDVMNMNSHLYVNANASLLTFDVEY